MGRYASGPFAPFPLTPTLSLREREQRASRSESRKVWIVLRGEKGSPSPQGRGPGGERGHRTPQRECPRHVVRPMPAGLVPDLSGFTISSLRLCRRSLTPWKIHEKCILPLLICVYPRSSAVS